MDQFNKLIADRARAALDRRREAILTERDFLGALTVPVKAAPNAPEPLRPPPMRRRSTPARALADAARGDAIERGPDMSEFYEHILELIRAVGRGMERSPGSFAEAEEETLRDHMLVTLNSHYAGSTYAEAFNRKGKTDILIRIHDRNAFIGECKKWTGAKKFNEALDQLFSYTTWQDSRLALIVYVKEKNPSSIVEKARAEMEGRPEFISWDGAARDGEFRCPGALAGRHRAQGKPDGTLLPSRLTKREPRAGCGVSAIVPSKQADRKVWMRVQSRSSHPEPESQPRRDSS